mgnify:CR=1 FL=1
MGAGRARGWMREEVRPVDKEVLIQYCEMKEEIKDIRRRIQKLDGVPGGAAPGI